MFRSALFTLAAAGACALPSPTGAEDAGPILHDAFDRAGSDASADGWSSKGDVVVKEKALHFAVDEEEFRPRTRRTFPVQRAGKINVSFLMDWVREAEGTWAFYMQLGHGEAMPKHLVYLDDLSKGVGINLVWGGGELVDFQKPGSFGHSKDGSFKPLFVVNDEKAKASLVERALISIAVDVDAHTYSVSFGGKTFTDLPFENEVPIDTIRFIAHDCSASGFSKTSIDDVIISPAR